MATCILACGRLTQRRIFSFCEEGFSFCVFQGGRFAVVGSYDGRCLFYSTDQLKYHTQIHVRSSRGKNARGRKISGIEPMPGEDKVGGATRSGDTLFEYDEHRRIKASLLHL